MSDDIERYRDRKPSLERKREWLDEQKRRYKEHNEQHGREVTTRELDNRFNPMAERVDRKTGW